MMEENQRKCLREWENNEKLTEIVSFNRFLYSTLQQIRFISPKEDRYAER